MKKDFSETLKKKGLKATEPRLLILQAFPAHCIPVNAEYLFEKVGKLVNEVTVYRTLAQFEEKGIVKRVELRRSSVYYELADGHHHHHIICTDCGKIESFESCAINPLSRKILSQSSKFSAITDHSLELFGTCTTCIQK